MGTRTCAGIISKRGEPWYHLVTVPDTHNTIFGKLDVPNKEGLLDLSASKLENSTVPLATLVLETLGALRARVLQWAKHVLQDHEMLTGYALKNRRFVRSKRRGVFENKLHIFVSA